MSLVALLIGSLSLGGRGAALEGNWIDTINLEAPSRWCTPSGVVEKSQIPHASQHTNDGTLVVMQVEVHMSLVCVDFQQSDVLSLPSFVVTSISLKASFFSIVNWSIVGVLAV